MPLSRYKPHDMEAYKAFVKTLVERYDGDGVDDMPGLKQPIKHWEVINEPEMGFIRPEPLNFFRGSPEDYLEVLKVTYEAIREADPEAKVLNGGIAYVPEKLEEWDLFWGKVFKLGGAKYIDILTVHNLNPYLGEALERLYSYLGRQGIKKPIWVTELQVAEGIPIPPTGEVLSREGQAKAIVKAYLDGFSLNVEKIFYTSYMAFPGGFETLAKSALIEAGERKPAYYAVKTMVTLLEGFSRAEKLEENLYRFILPDKTEVYVVWSGGKLPSNIKGEVLTVTLTGKTNLTDVSTLRLGGEPTYIVKGSREKLESLMLKLREEKQPKIQPPPVSGMETVEKPKIGRIDLNGDGRVDYGDLEVLKGVYGLSTGEKRFKPEVDLNGDGIIDIVDLAVLAYHYGENV